MYYAHGFDKESKVSRYKQWQQVFKSTGLKPEKLENAPELPENLHYMWDLFFELCNGCEKIGYPEIDAYQRVTGLILTNWEITVLIKMDGQRQKNNA